jgi:hypothetical protein
LLTSYKFRLFAWGAVHKGLEALSRTVARLL